MSYSVTVYQDEQTGKWFGYLSFDGHIYGSFGGFDDANEAAAHGAMLANNKCPMCKHYDSPGFMINAWETVPCFECNPGNHKGLEKPKRLRAIN